MEVFVFLGVLVPWCLKVALGLFTHCIPPVDSIHPLIFGCPSNKGKKIMHYFYFAGSTHFLIRIGKRFTPCA
jgi:hypothetical protein